MVLKNDIKIKIENLLLKFEKFLPAKYRKLTKKQKEEERQLEEKLKRMCYHIEYMDISTREMSIKEKKYEEKYYKIKDLTIFLKYKFGVDFETNQPIYLLEKQTLLNKKYLFLIGGKWNIRPNVINDVNDIKEIIYHPISIDHSSILSLSLEIINKYFFKHDDKYYNKFNKLRKYLNDIYKSKNPVYSSKNK